MKRIWFLWLAVAYVAAHIITVPLQLYIGLWWDAGVGVLASVVVGTVVWNRRQYLWNRREYRQGKGDRRMKSLRAWGAWSLSETIRRIANRR